MKIITIDIETIPSQRPDVRDYIAQTITHPAQMKKAETIAEWEKNQKPQAIEDAWLKTALDGTFGEIICASMRSDEMNKPVSFYRTLNKDESEAILIQSIFDRLNQHGKVKYCGHNIKQFDLLFLYQRAIINGIQIPLDVQAAIDESKYARQRVFDTMLVWSGNSNNWVSVDKLCFAFGIDSPKTIMNGSEVWNYVQFGDYDKVVEYNQADVNAEHELAIKMGALN